MIVFGRALEEENWGAPADCSTHRRMCEGGLLSPAPVNLSDGYGLRSDFWVDRKKNCSTEPAQFAACGVITDKMVVGLSQ